MTGNELVKFLRQHAGPLMIPMLTPFDVIPIEAKRVDVIDWAKGLGDATTGMEIKRGEDGRLYMDTNDSRIYTDEEQ